jgi:hypothetical protein
LLLQLTPLHAFRQDARLPQDVPQADDPFTHEATLAGLHPAALQAFSIAATFEAVTGQPDFLQAFAAAATFAALVVHFAVLQAFKIFAAFAADTLHPALLQAFTTVAVLHVPLLQLVAAFATGIIENSIAMAKARLTIQNHLFFCKVFIALPPLIEFR